MAESDAGGTEIGLTIVVVDDPAGDELADLHDWLRQDVRGVRMAPVERPPIEGQMSGGVVAALETAVLSKELLGMVVTGIGGWLSARATTRRTKIRVKRGDVEVEIDSANVEQADQIARRLGRELGGV
ncbi:hypothetical protein ABZS66_10210 [Dactylosporangium sp. NPDC005572]|uniref:effector-associated constant component EACC1 n=1 Tax=Dactylosporangium sp. NPDC005572 TaxID=3156889 RepID=UPI0033A062F7